MKGLPCGLMLAGVVFFSFFLFFFAVTADCSLSLLMSAVINKCMALISRRAAEVLALLQLLGDEEREWN